jgi:hypothetical protein
MQLKIAPLNCVLVKGVVAVVLQRQEDWICVFSVVKPGVADAQESIADEMYEQAGITFTSLAAPLKTEVERVL